LKRFQAGRDSSRPLMKCFEHKAALLLRIPVILKASNPTGRPQAANFLVLETGRDRFRLRLRAPPRILSNLGMSRFAPKGSEPAGSAIGAVVSGETNSGVEEISAELSLAMKSGCPATETVARQRRGSNERTIPCGSRPSMAAFTRSGARKASEIVMLILRTLHPSWSAPDAGAGLPPVGNNAACQPNRRVTITTEKIVHGRQSPWDHTRTAAKSMRTWLQNKGSLKATDATATTKRLDL
jgi:hypothetical protein